MTEGGALVEVTCRTLHSRLLLRPGLSFNEIFIGALARAQHRYGVDVVLFACISNHLHLLLIVDDAFQLARFMGYFLSKLAKEVGRLTGWRQKIFGRRYQHIVVSDEEVEQVRRFRYALSHGVKEHLVERLRHWPGPHPVRALIDGEALEGWWFDRTKEYAASRRGKEFSRYEYATRETLTLEPLPCWKHLTGEQRRQRVASLVEEIETDAARQREARGLPVLGPAAVLAQDPRSEPRRTKRSPAPRFHATEAVRKVLYEAYRDFVRAYREAAGKLRAGNRDAPFPLGCFPPALPFTGG